MKKQKAIVNCENVKLYCLPKWYINCIIQSNKRRRKVKDSNQNIAKAVLKIRQDNKLSQEQFAEMVGVTRQVVSRWEMGNEIRKSLRDIYEMKYEVMKMAGDFRGSD